MSKRTKHKVRKGDIARVVLTETAPDEVPIMFSNDGFYKHCAEYLNKEATYPLQELFNRVIGYSQTKNATIPITYKIKKNQIALRRLALLHPAAQFRFVSFYEKYKDLILYYCSKSPISIRHPQKVGRTFYIKNENKNINKYKNKTVDTAYTDLISKHSSSFFQYRSDRLYRFFETETFVTLEKKYSTLWLIDVTKCFDSIYTHAISWALKDKDFVKQQKQAISFGSDFDDLMMFAKHAETNGIAIGPEVSRIFAEIIFQDIDLMVIQALNKKGLALELDYTIRRYVDDYIIFAKNDADAQKITETISSCLLDYNLHLNEGKSEKLSRPFFTKKSKAIHEINAVIDAFMAKFTNASRPLIPVHIRHSLRLKKSLFDDIKAVAASNKSDYGLFSNYVISSLCKRIIDLIEDGETQISTAKASPADYKNAIILLLEAAFFLYTVNPTVSASYRLCKAIILSARFAKKEIPAYEASVKQRVLEMFISFYESSPPLKKHERGDAVPLELVNLLIAVGDMGKDYLVPADVLRAIFDIDNDSSYYELMSCLYYIKDNSMYSGILGQIEAVVTRKLSNLEGVSTRAEEAFVLLDTFTCPYFTDDYKKELLAKLSRVLSLQMPTDNDTFQYLKKYPWFINWVEIDLINILEKRELKAVY